ncbi:glycosyltransferase family 2 protein [Anaeromyxobacter diazotrophicus]|uniref:glycosyltransferase family 2 protein n=1 Tax=Anaeromyxobacter diazotrophicus TaxID=2590199 RepID=UPI001590822F|nr:cellulose synthase catalytic subunit [Anaeromyxobacter diazotrophicus]
MDATCARCEDRLPGEPVAPSSARDLTFQALAVFAFLLGLRYLTWRWTSSLNPSALAFAVMIAAAESLAFLGDVLFFLSIWRITPVASPPPPATLREIGASPATPDRELRVDVFIATYDEPVELVALSVRDAKRLRYPHPLTLRIHVLDDGRRGAMRDMAREEGVGYLTRPDNAGYKAGNLRNGLQHTDGDLVVICDADTRPLPGLLEETLGYFRDPRVAWVQTPQWFYDVSPGTPLPEWLASRLRLGPAGGALGRGIELLLGPITVGGDPLGNDASTFYGVIQASRNWCNAAFCCGAGSIHRREAVMESALKQFAQEVTAATRRFADRVPDRALRRPLAAAVAGAAARRTELMPYRFHVSEDIYTSIIVHADPRRRWRSVHHPRPLTRMLSPQDLLAWTIQRFKYASGTLDIGWHDNPLKRPGLTAWQKLMYLATIYSYLSPLWLVPLLLAPVVFFFAGVTPVVAFDPEFFAQIVPFLVAKRLAFMVGTWGFRTWRAEQYHLASAWLHLKALLHVLAGKPLRFPVTPKTRAERRFLRLVAPHVLLVAAMAAGLVYRGSLIASGRAPADTTAYLVNVFWSLYGTLCLLPMIAAGLGRRPGAALA